MRPARHRLALVLVLAAEGAPAPVLAGAAEPGLTAAPAPGRVPARASAREGLSPPAALERALREAAEASCPGLTLVFDKDLARAARAYAGAVRAGRVEVTGQALAFIASLETFDPAPIAGIATTNAPAQADRAVGDIFPKSCQFDHVGVAGVRLSDQRAVVAVLASSRAVELSSIPGRVEELAQVKVEGRLVQSLARPRLFHMKPDGAVDEQPLPISQLGQFSVAVRLVETGEHALEILADGAGGPQVVALRRVFVGVEPPVAPPALPSARGNGLAAVGQAINALRHTRGLPLLQRDPALDAVAESHSRAMARARKFAHILPEDGALDDRLDKAGYARRSAGENLGLAEDALAAHEAIAQSPAHLANLLDPRHRRLGLGAVPGLTPDGSSSSYLTEVLAAPLLRSADPAADVMRALAEGRAAKGLPPLVREARLDAIAAAEARAIALAGGPLQIRPHLVERALESLPDLRSAVAEMVVADAPERCVGTQNAAEAGWARVGVGALYASSGKYGPGRLWVMLIFAR